MKPFRIFIEGKELLGYTNARLSRKKKDLTGEFSCDIFFNYMPQKPVMVQALAGKQVLVYVGGHLAFVGSLDKRKGKGSQGEEGGEGTEVSSSIGPNQYSVSLTARGKTKYLIDSSHQHKTGTMLKPKTREVAEALLKDFQIELDWNAEDVKLDKVRFRDGAMVETELRRLGNENGYYMYEDRTGNLRVTEGTRGAGVDLVLGHNILEFSADQTEEHQRSDIVVKGQRTSTEVWGEDAVLKTVKRLKNSNVTSNIPIIIQHFGDATPEALERRGKFETDIRTAQSLNVSVTVFHVQEPSGQPWDIGLEHYVEVPPEGVFDTLECVELEYIVDANDTLQTRLTLAPPPSAKSGKSGLQSALGNGNEKGSQRRTQLGVESPDIWKPSDIEFSPDFSAPSSQFPNPNYLGGIDTSSAVPLKLPPST